jgi:hypothetical protein
MRCLFRTPLRPNCCLFYALARAPTDKAEALVALLYAELTKLIATPPPLS